MLLFFKLLLSCPTCCKGSESQTVLQTVPQSHTKTHHLVVQCLCGHNLKLILIFAKSILQTGACSACQKHAEIPFIWKGAGCTKLTGLSGLWYHSYPFFSDTAFQVIPSQWIPVLDYCPLTVLACIFQTKSHLYFPTMCLISLDNLFFSALTCV